MVIVMADDVFWVAASPTVPRPRCRSILPGVTFSELRSLMQGGALPPGHVKRRRAGYVVEFEIGPRRCLLVNSRLRQPRVFQTVEATIKTLRALSNQPLVVRLDAGRLPMNGELEFEL